MSHTRSHHQIYRSLNVNTHLESRPQNLDLYVGVGIHFGIDCIDKLPNHFWKKELILYHEWVIVVHWLEIITQPFPKTIWWWFEYQTWQNLQWNLMSNLEVKLYFSGHGIFIVFWTIPSSQILEVGVQNACFNKDKERKIANYILANKLWIPEHLPTNIPF